MEAKTPGHLYELKNNSGKSTQTLQFLHKEEKNGKLVTVADGVTTEEVLGAVADRLNFLFDKLPDTYTKSARWHIGQAMGALADRTVDRKKRAVEGTNKA